MNQMLFAKICLLCQIFEMFCQRRVVTFNWRVFKRHCKRITVKSDIVTNTTAVEETHLKNYADFKKYLRSNKIFCRDGVTCLQVECRLCKRHKQRSSTAASAYVNKRTGVFLCPECDVKKTLIEALSAYEGKDALLEIRSSPDIEYRSSEFDKLVPVTQDICDSIGIKGLKVTDMENLGAKYNSLAQTVHFPLNNVANRVVGEKVLHLVERSENTLQNQNCSGLLINCRPQIDKSKAIIVTNIMDFLVLAAQRFDNHAIVCLPYFLKSLPQECLPALERFEELVFWFHIDSAGWDTSRIFSNKMDEKRCLLIRPTDSDPSPYEAQCRGLNLRHILQRALPVRHKSITTFSSLRNDILSELQNIEKVNGVKWRRFPLLNKLLKGHRKGELTIMTGPTGCGKTTFVSEYSLDLALQGVSTLWGSFEIRNSRLAATLLRQFVGYSLENKLNEFGYWANEFEKYPMYFMTFHGQQPLKVVMEAIEHAQYIHDIHHVIIDNLQFMMGISASYRIDKFWEQDAIIAAFRSLATKRNVHVTLVMHPRKERDAEDLTTSSVFGTAKATQEADNVLIIQDKRLSSMRGKKYLQVAKNRYSGDLGIMPLEFDKDSLSYANPKKKKGNDKLEEQQQSC